MAGSTNGELVAKQVHAAYAREGYVNEDGTKDSAKMRALVTEIVAKAKVLGKRERNEKAITRGDLVAKVFPNLPTPDSFDEEEDAGVVALAEKVYKEISADVWNETQPSARGRVQRAIASHMGNGYVLCRTKVTIDNNRVDAVYVTDVIECIRLDFTRPDNQRLNKRIEQSTENREMLILRQPDNAKAYASEYDKTLKQAALTAHNSVQLTMESVADSGHNVDEDDE